MATLTIRNLNENTKSIIRQRAAKNGHSMEEEARQILNRATLEVETTGLGTLFSNMYAEVSDIGFELPERSPGREPLDFSLGAE